MVDERPESLSGVFTSSFAYTTIKDRLPETLTKVIDYLSRLAGDYHKVNDDEKADDAKKIVSKLSKLKNEMQTDKPLSLIKDDYSDTDKWNAFLKDIPIMEENKNTPSWFTVSWLSSECYFYRKIYEALQLSKYHRNCDPFLEQKLNSFKSSTEAFKSLAKFTVDILETNEVDSVENLCKDFEFLLEYSLWGNKCDLSLSVGVNAINELHESTEFKTLLEHILSNHTEDIWKHILKMKEQTNEQKRRIDFILDNAGFELLTDLCLAEFLVDKKFCDVIYFHVKSFPWFVSDTQESDFLWTINECVKFDDNKLIQTLGQRWNKQVTIGVFKIVQNEYWTIPRDYSDMREHDIDLYNELSKSNLIVFKGDLNYRKLVGDRNWNPTTPFAKALNGFCPSPLCTLRTIKADVVVGLENGKAEQTSQKDDDWMISAKYGVIQFMKEL